VITSNGNALTETFSFPTLGISGTVTCVETFSVSGSTATLLPSRTMCSVPQGTTLGGTPVMGVQSVSGTLLMYTGADNGGPSTTLTCMKRS